MSDEAEDEFASRLEELIRLYVPDGAPGILRLEFAMILMDAAGRISPIPGWVAPLRQLARSRNPSFRRIAASTLPTLPDDVFPALADYMLEDLNPFVRELVEKAIKCRGLGREWDRKIRKGVACIRRRYRDFEKAFGAPAARQAQRMAGIVFDDLIGGLVHDMRGILAAVRTEIKQLGQRLKVGDAEKKSHHDKMKRLRDLTDYLHLFLDDMRMYARAIREERCRIHVGNIVWKAIEIARNGLLDAGFATETVAVEVIAPDSLYASLFPLQTVTALMHLLRNGFEALAEYAATFERRLIVRVRPDGADGVRIVVEDNGPGIDPDTLRELLTFTPGTTTRKGRGTGFGLPTANRFAEAHGGRLEIVSTRGQGASFTLVLPAAEDDCV